MIWFLLLGWTAISVLYLYTFGFTPKTFLQMFILLPVFLIGLITVLFLDFFRL
jgi:hypothetical protein